MVWLKAEYEFGSLFSCRMPDFSSQYALSSPLPAPSTIKLAIVATAIINTGNVEYGAKIFDSVKNSEIKIGLPKNIAVSNVLIKRLKMGDPSKQKPTSEGTCEGCGKKDVKLWLLKDVGKSFCKKCATRLISTFGIRGYVHFLEPIEIYINIKNRDEEIKDLLRRIRQFGTSDSLVCCKNISEEEPSDGCVGAVDVFPESVNQNVVVVPVKDLNADKKIKFEHVNIYAKEKSNDVFVGKFYFIPILRSKQGKNWIIYETSSEYD